MYTIFQQPPFSKSAGNGSSHQNVGRPNSIRIGYLDALARLTGNTYAADFVRRTLKVEPDYMKKALLNKPGDLAWFRLQCDKPLPEGEGLTALPAGYVFPATGLASFQTNWDRVGGNAMWSFPVKPLWFYLSCTCQSECFQYVPWWENHYFTVADTTLSLPTYIVCCAIVPHVLTIRFW